MRNKNDLFLIDFVELQLKSKADFRKTMDLVLATGLKKYMDTTW